MQTSDTERSGEIRTDLEKLRCTEERASISATIIRTVLRLPIFRVRQEERKRKRETGERIHLTWPEGKKTEAPCNYKVGEKKKSWRRGEESRRGGGGGRGGK